VCELDLFDIAGTGSVDRWIDAAWRFEASRVVHAAVRLGLAALLVSPRRPEEAALSLGLDPEMTRRLLGACAAAGLVERTPRGYVLDPALAGIGEGGPGSAAGAIEADARAWDAWDALEDALNPGAAPALSGDGAARAFTREDARWVARALPRLSGRLLEVGAGRGLFSAELARLSGDLRPPVIEGLPSARADDERRWTPGPGGAYDVVLLAGALAGPGLPEPALELASARARPGGRLVIYESVLYDGVAAPRGAALLNVTDPRYDLRSLSSRLRSHGFRGLRLAATNPVFPNPSLLLASRGDRGSEQA